VFVALGVGAASSVLSVHVGSRSAADEHLHLLLPGLALDLHHPASGRVMRGDVAVVDGQRGMLVRLDPADAEWLTPGSMIEVRFAKVRDAAYRFTSEVRGREAELVRLRFPTTVERLQHRRHVRASTQTPVTFALAGPRAVSTSSQPGWINGTINDLSATGVSLRTDADLMVNDVVLVRFEVDGRRRRVEVDTRSRVVRREPLGGRFWRYGIELIDMNGTVEDELVGAVFHQLAQH
jgi:c-di-GMP-binding flagellar brake protein YcgR